jgi:predicted phage terminase large subunit-like protein
VEPKGDKVVRLMTVSALIESGRVFLPNMAPWLPEFEVEVAGFPNAVHDDQVDSMTQALDYMSTARTPAIHRFAV